MSDITNNVTYRLKPVKEVRSAGAGDERERLTDVVFASDVEKNHSPASGKHFYSIDQLEARL